MRRGELVLLGAFAIALVVAAVAGLRSGALHEWDSRLSTDVSAPRGAKGLALTLERLGVRIERWRRPLLAIDSVLARSDAKQRLALLDVTTLPIAPERRALARYIEAGGDLFIVGISGMEECLGVEINLVELDSAQEVRAEDFRFGVQYHRMGKSSVLPPAGIGDLPDVHWTVAIDPDTTAQDRRSREADEDWVQECGLVRMGSEVLVQTRDSVPVMVRLRFAGGGLVTLLADNEFISNRALKETDVGALVIPVLLARRPQVLVVDEYHHDLGSGRSLWLSALEWLVSNPGGWALVQLGLAALLALALAAIRFGPAMKVVERRRRSPQEHLEALATGLERSNEAGTAISLIVSGLRRRLSSGGTPAPSSLNVDAWLAALGKRATPKARAELSNLRDLVQRGASHRDVLEAARTAEILWKRLGS